MSMKFEELGLPEEVLQAIKEKKFDEPTEIQEKAIPLVVQGNDVIGGASTGSGKTLAFGAGIIKHTLAHQGVQALVLTPTRELAEQVCKELRFFSKYQPLSIIPIYGGVGINPQIQQAQKADVLVATPGRLLDHMERGTISLVKVKTLVLDEADRMFDMGFAEDVLKIIRACPKDRQTMLFSATITKEVEKIGNKYMRKPIRVSARIHVDETKLEQVFYTVDDKAKFSLLVHLLKKEHTGLVMIFCNTQKNTTFVSRNLESNGIDAQGLHGGFSQDKRSKTLSKFHNNKLQVLVCTDVAARGLDIRGVTHVYNYDIPNDSTQYVHRIGRTARAGKEGKAINLLSSRDFEQFQRVLNERPEIITKKELPSFERAKIGWRDKPAQSGGRSSFGGRGRSSGGGFRGRSSGGRPSGPRGRSSGGGQQRSHHSGGRGRSGGDGFKANTRESRVRR